MAALARRAVVALGPRLSRSAAAATAQAASTQPAESYDNLLKWGKFVKKDPQLELWINQKKVETLNDADWAWHGYALATFNMAKHDNIFEDVFAGKPSKNFCVKFGKSLVHSGNIIPQKETTQKPVVQYASAPEEKWTLCLVDPDCIVHEVGKPIDTEHQRVHWLVTNIKGSDVSSGNEVVPFQPPAPFKGTGYHRYVAVLFRQPGDVALSSSDVQPSLLPGVQLVSTASLAAAHKLSPAGLAFFQSIHDPAAGASGADIALQPIHATAAVAAPSRSK